MGGGDEGKTVVGEEMMRERRRKQVRWEGRKEARG